MRKLLTLLLFVVPLALLAQDEDYYEPEKGREILEENRDEVVSKLRELHRWGPKLGIEINASLGYSHFYTPSTITGGFYKAVGGFGYDLGTGIRLRIYHKLAISMGVNYSGRGYNIGLPAYFEDTIPGGAVQTYELDIYEKARLNFLGFYIKPVIELSKKFHLALMFHQSWMVRYKGESYGTYTSPPTYAGQVDTLLNRSAFDLEDSMFELGLEFAYKYVISPELILKPHIGINFAVTPIFHTGAFLQTPFGEWEQNPSFMSLRIGVVFETGVWLDKMKN